MNGRMEQQGREKRYVWIVKNEYMFDRKNVLFWREGSVTLVTSRDPERPLLWKWIPEGQGSRNSM